ncbi:hypothetical protein [Nocardia sp. NPDC049707]|uniref:hypothetical protein n=1 Tax=Nocardia sp. NPDC049707 TaxID=3154735 RepID=UPI0034227E43
MSLPSSAVMFMLPVVVAVALTWRDGGGVAAVALVRRAVDRPAAGPRWYVLAVLLIPVIAALNKDSVQLPKAITDHRPIPPGGCRQT